MTGKLSTGQPEPLELGALIQHGLLYTLAAGSLIPTLSFYELLANDVWGDAIDLYMYGIAGRGSLSLVANHGKLAAAKPIQPPPFKGPNHT